MSNSVPLYMIFLRKAAKKALLFILRGLANSIINCNTFRKVLFNLLVIDNN